MTSSLISEDDGSFFGQKKGTSKRRAPTPKRESPPSSPNQRFFFVDAKSSSKGKRSHVMKHHIREKRKGQNKLLPGESSTQSPGRPNRILPWTRRAAQRISELDALTTPATSLAPSPSVVKTQSSSQAAVAPPLWPRSTSPLVAWSLAQGDVSASRSDPFETLPLHITDETQQLMDLWTTKLAYWSGQNSYMKTAVFKEAMMHPMTFHVTILSYSARYQSHIAGYKDTPVSIVYSTTADRMLADYKRNAHDPFDNKIIMALTALALQEDRYGDKKKATQHLSDAMRRANRYPGRSPLHETFLHYVRYTVTPQSPLQDPNDVLQLVNLLRGAETLALHSPFVGQVPLLASVFQFGTPLHLLLSSGPHPTSVPNGDRMWVVKYGSHHDTCRTASLVYITMSILDYSDQPEKCTRFLNALMSKIYERELDRSTSTESLLWLLLEEQYPDLELKNPFRAWFVGDMMKIVSRLPPPLQFQFSELLLRQLMLREADLEVSIERFEGEVWKSLQPLQEQRSSPRLEQLLPLPRLAELPMR